MATTKNRFVKTSEGFTRADTPRQLTPEQILGPTNMSTQTIPTQAPMATSPTAANPFMTGDYSTVTDPADAFNVLTFDLLKRAQGVDSTELYKRRRELQRASLAQGAENVQAGSGITLSPEQQESIRASRGMGLSTEIDQNAADIAKAEQAIQNYQTIYQQATQFGQEFADKMVAPQSVIDSYVKAIEANPSNLSTILSGVNDKTREKVIQSIDYAKLNQGGAVDKNKLLSIDEAQKLGVPYGTTVGQAIEKGITPPTEGGDEIAKKVTEQDWLDYQTVASSMQSIEGILARYGATLDTFDEKIASTMNDNDAESISVALARVRQPDVSRQGGDPGSALAPTGAKEKVKQYVRGLVENKKYVPQRIVDAVKGAKAISEQRAASLGVGSGVTPIAPNLATGGTPSIGRFGGSVGLISTANAATTPNQMRLPNGTIVTRQADGTYK